MTDKALPTALLHEATTLLAMMPWPSQGCVATAKILPPGTPPHVPHCREMSAPRQGGRSGGRSCMRRGIPSQRRAGSWTGWRCPRCYFQSALSRRAPGLPAAQCSPPHGRTGPAHLQWGHSMRIKGTSAWGEYACEALRCFVLCKSDSRLNFTCSISVCIRVQLLLSSTQCRRFVAACRLQMHSLCLKYPHHSNKETCSLPRIAQGEKHRSEAATSCADSRARHNSSPT